jgi:hypothetical protein
MLLLLHRSTTDEDATMTKSVQELSNKALVIQKALFGRSLNKPDDRTTAQIKYYDELKAEFDKRVKEYAAAK